MDIEFDLDEEAYSCLSFMAEEAGLSVGEMAQIAVFNLIAIYLKQHGTIEQEESLTGPEIRKPPVQSGG